MKPPEPHSVILTMDEYRALSRVWHLASQVVRLPGSETALAALRMELNEHALRPPLPVVVRDEHGAIDIPATFAPGENS